MSLIDALRYPVVPGWSFRTFDWSGGRGRVFWAKRETRTLPTRLSHFARDEEGDLVYVENKR